MSLICPACKETNSPERRKCLRCGSVVFDFQQVAEDIFYNFQRTIQGVEPIRADNISCEFILPPPADKKGPNWIAKFFTCGLLREGTEELFQQTVIRLMEFKHPGVDQLVAGLSYKGAVVVFYEVPPQGKPFGEVLKTLAPQNTQTTKLARQLIDLISAFQQSNIIHGNINPDNIKMVSEKLNLAYLGVVDILKLLDVDLHKLDIGRGEYKSPQQLNNPNDPDFSWDRYAVATLCYQLATGENPAAIAKSIKSGSTKPPLGTALGKTLFHMKAFNQDPSKQFQSSQEILKAFKQWPKLDLAGKLGSIIVPSLLALIVIVVVIVKVIQGFADTDTVSEDNDVQPVVVKPAILRIDTQPINAAVFINGESYTDIKEGFEVEPGKVKITVSAPGYSEVKDTVVLAEEEDVSRSYVLRKRLFYDGFSDNANGWFVGSKGGVSASINDGFYVIQGEGIVKRKKSNKFNRFELHSNMTFEQINPGSEAGLLLLYKGPADFIQLMTSTNKGCLIDRKARGKLDFLGELGKGCMGKKRFKVKIKSLGSKLVINVNGKGIAIGAGNVGDELGSGDVAFKVTGDGILKVDFLELLVLENK